jgi:hypothetical protein
MHRIAPPKPASPFVIVKPITAAPGVSLEWKLNALPEFSQSMVVDVAPAKMSLDNSGLVLRTAPGYVAFK